MNTHPPAKRIEAVHCAILGLSTFLLGLYFGAALPAGVDLVVLQTGLIGVLGFLGLTQITTLSQQTHQTEQIQPQPTAAASGRVERRLERHLDRHMVGRHIHRVDRGRRRRHPMSVKRTSRRAVTVPMSAD